MPHSWGRLELSDRRVFPALKDDHLVHRAEPHGRADGAVQVVGQDAMLVAAQAWLLEVPGAVLRRRFKVVPNVYGVDLEQSII
jgi:hypothetical protein